MVVWLFALAKLTVCFLGCLVYSNSLVSCSTQFDLLDLTCVVFDLLLYGCLIFLLWPASLLAWFRPVWLFDLVCLTCMVGVVV